jgi:hypothetical protein
LTEPEYCFFSFLSIRSACDLKIAVRDFGRARQVQPFGQSAADRGTRQQHRNRHLANDPHEHVHTVPCAPFGATRADYSHSARIFQTARDRYSPPAVADLVAAGWKGRYRFVNHPRAKLPRTAAREIRMAGSVNKVILIGNLGRDPEVRSFQNGGKVVNLRIATSETWRDRNSGERKERTEWHSVAIFNEASGQDRRAVSEERKHGLHRGLARDPQMAGPVGAGQATRPKSSFGPSFRQPDPARRPG